MAVVGGPIESVNLNGREFPVAEDAESQRKLGGWEIEVKAFGNGDARIIKTRVPLSVDGLAVGIDDSREDSEYLQDLTDLNYFFPVAITYASGVTYQATAQISGEFSTSSKESTSTIALSGPGKLTKQS